MAGLDTGNCPVNNSDVCFILKYWVERTMSMCLIIDKLYVLSTVFGKPIVIIMLFLSLKLASQVFII